MISKKAMHDNYIATIGLRAGYMSAIGMIDIGGTVFDEDRFAEFASQLAARFEAGTAEEECFDIFIEEELLKQYRRK